MSPVSIRGRKRRDEMRKAGLRPVQIWGPHTRAPGFAEEARRQSRLVAEAEAADPEPDSFMEAAWAELGPEEE
jgi:hypothetical protein